ncbi:cupredoxin domain-containing protein [Methanoregula sp.]|uniref:cupredoxin domain-containing protein n=1 Tax=Methanoregula sp. TaxID=2052170 RepID=UPI002C0F1F48|nr:plastocyanin/azurin family copper-binding protein [Methanoregula sp.]HVP95648.1 plastocyanin/azurin family copper-binding protein [Methanoregula sp.]
MKYAIVLCTAAIALLLVAGCSQIFPPPPGLVTPTATPAAAPQATALPITVPTTVSVSANTVIIQKMAYTPAEITVSAGSIVRWVNEDKVTHSVLFSPDAKINTFALSPSQSYSVKFDKAGVYNYTCSIYSSMQGAVIVTP